MCGNGRVEMRTGVAYLLDLIDLQHSRRRRRRRRRCRAGQESMAGGGRSRSNKGRKKHRRWWRRRTRHRENTERGRKTRRQSRVMNEGKQK